MNLILASTSPHRAGLLETLRLPFIQIDPGVGESMVAGESPAARAERLAREKAEAVASQDPHGPWLILGSDQVASKGRELFGKPGNFDRAFAQLTSASGNWVAFDTAIHLLNDTGAAASRVERFEVRFRDLSPDTITRYLNLDQPFDCAGSIRAECLGITLIADTRGRDVNTLLGLPLMLLTEMLAGLGIDVLNEIN